MPVLNCPSAAHERVTRRGETDMGTIIAFPIAAATSRAGTSFVTRAAGSGLKTGQVLILPVIRIERQTDETNGSGPEEGAAPGRRRKRRVRS